MKAFLFLAMSLLLSIQALKAQIGDNEYDPNEPDPLFEEKEEGTELPDLSESIKKGKILDDSTKQIYGPTTSKFTYEEEIKSNRRRYHVIDTLLDNYHRFNFVNRYQNLYQDLGNIGTAIVPIFYQVPDAIGATSGFHVYDLYFHGPERIKYYDTKSPYTDLNIVFGGEGRSMTDVRFSRNIKPHWNVGFDYRGYFIDKTILKMGRGDRNVNSVGYDFYTHYNPDSIPYEIVASFSRINHVVNESGGVLEAGDVALTNDNASELLFEGNINPYLTSAESRELRTQFHIFHQYKLSKLVQIYHEADRIKQLNDFENTSLSGEPNATDGTPNPYVGRTLGNAAQTQDRMLFRIFQNEVGIKGDLAALYYNVYYKARQVDVNYNQLDLKAPLLLKNGDGEFELLNLKDRVLESYGGANVRLNLDSMAYVSGELEYQVGEGYRLGGEIQTKWFEGRVGRMEYLPSYLVQAYQGNHHAWANRFNRITATEISGELKLDLDGFSLRPFASLKSVGNYVYFNQDTIPEQVGASFEVLSTGVYVYKRFFKHFHFKNRFILTTVEGDASEVFRVPKLFNNTQLYYENILINGNLQLQLGFDINFKSAYFANAYNPVLRQFHLQDSFESPAYLNADFFANLKINRGRLFVKYLNLWKAFNDDGYIPTPLYPGQVNIVDFGFSWAFYD